MHRRTVPAAEQHRPTDEQYGRGLGAGSLIARCRPDLEVEGHRSVEWERPATCGLTSLSQGPRTSDHGLRTTDSGPRTPDLGLRTTDSGPRTSDLGLRTSDFGPRTSGHGLRTTDFGPRPPHFALRTAALPSRLRRAAEALRTRIGRRKPATIRGHHFALRTAAFRATSRRQDCGGQLARVAKRGRWKPRTLHGPRTTDHGLRTTDFVIAQ